jgi:hypothetical protein
LFAAGYAPPTTLRGFTARSLECRHFHDEIRRRADLTEERSNLPRSGVVHVEHLAIGTYDASQNHLAVRCEMRENGRYIASSHALHNLLKLSVQCRTNLGIARAARGACATHEANDYERCC